MTQAELTKKLSLLDRNVFRSKFKVNAWNDGRDTLTFLPTLYLKV